MSYLVLARKYRPTTFAEVVGQEHVTRTLGNAFTTNRVHHAFLFCGPRGCGKTTLARIVGKALACEQGPTSEPCGVCSACVSIGNGSAVDYQELDGASNRGIDAIRELTEAVRYQPAIFRKKIYVIDEVHMLTPEAFNALLKTLEEPPPHVTFVLATTEPHKLPNTILSRCQRYDFKLVPASKLAQHLTRIFVAEKLPVEAGAISLLVRESGGSVRDALSLSDQIISFVGADATITEKHVAEVLGVADRTLTRTLVRAVAEGAAGTALGAVESAIERGVDEVQLARAIVRYLRDLSVLQVAPDRPELVDASDEERTELAREAAGFERTRITQMFERMLRCCDELGKTLQPRLVLDCALIDISTIEPLVPLGDLLERLGELEQRIARGGGAAVGSSGGGAGARSAPRAAAPAPPPARPASAVVTIPTPAASKVEPMPVAAPLPAASPAPVSMQPSGPVPSVHKVASGSGPTSDVKLATPTSAEQALATWNQLLSILETRRKFSLLGYYEPARVMKWTPEEIELGFPVDVHHMGEMAADKSTVEELRGVLRELGQPVKVSVRMLDARESSAAGPGAVRSSLETMREQKQTEKVAREAEARAHPITKQVLKEFGAQIKEIKTDV